MQKTRKISYKMAILCILALATLVLLGALAPYVDDDWDWGGPGGLERLAQGFADYNGRYLGNVLVLLLTRSRALKAVAVGAGFFLMAYLPARAVAKGSGAALLLSLSLLLAMPSAMLGQTLAWASGFANYGVAAAALLGVLSLLMPLCAGRRAVPWALRGAGGAGTGRIAAGRACDDLSGGAGRGGKRVCGRCARAGRCRGRWRCWRAHCWAPQ